MKCAYLGILEVMWVFDGTYLVSALQPETAWSTPVVNKLGFSSKEEGMNTTVSQGESLKEALERTCSWIWASARWLGEGLRIGPLLWTGCCQEAGLFLRWGIVFNLP